jgi:hypothetical protein
VAIALQEGQILVGPSFDEPVRVETIRAEGNGTWTVGVVGTRSEQFRRVTLTQEQLNALKILSPPRRLTEATGSCFDWACKPTHLALPTNSIRKKRSLGRPA